MEKRYPDIKDIAEKMFFPLELILYYCNTWQI